MSQGAPERELSLVDALWRGALGYCPRCGQGRVLGRWLRVADRCADCGLKLLEDEGEPWAFIVILDRVFVLALIVILYFQLAPAEPLAAGGVLVAITVIFVGTTKFRFGLCLALSYRTKRWWDSRPKLD